MRTLWQWDGNTWWASLMAAVIGSILSLSLAWYMKERSHAEVSVEFQQVSEKLVQSLERRLESYDYGLHGLHGLQGMMTVTRGKLADQDFRLYLADHDVAAEYPGALGFGFIRRVAPDALESYIRNRLLVRNMFHLQTFATNPGDRYIIETIEPYESNWMALGTDIASDPVRLAAANIAMQTGDAALSDPVRLEQDARGERGFLYLYPFYRYGSAASTPALRKEALEGWVYVPIQINRLMANLQDPGEKLFDYELFMGPNVEQEALLYDNDGHLQDKQKPPSSDGITERQFVRQVHLNIGGQTLTLRISSLPRFESQYGDSNSKFFLLAGMVITSLLVWALWLVGRTRQRALRLAGEMSAAAHDREAQINAVFNNTAESIVTVDRRGTIKSFNRAAQELFGYTEEEAHGRNMAILYVHYYSLDESGIREIMAGGQHFGSTSLVEIRGHDRYGREFPIEVSFGEFQMGSEVVFVCLMRDISRRKQQEADKAAIQQRLQLALDAAEFGVWQWWPDLKRFEWDSNTCHLYGVDAQDYPRDYDGWAQLIHEDDLDRIVESLYAVAEGGGKNSDVYRIRRPDGTIRYLFSHMRMVADGDGRRVAIGVTQDVTEQKRIEESLRVSEERFVLAAQAAQEGIWDWDLRTGQIWFSAQWKAHFGYEKDELENTLSMWEKLILPEDRQEILAQMDRFNRGEADRHEAIQRFRHKDGHIVFIRSRAVQLRNAQGQVTRIVGSHEDITGLLRQENDLRESRERLALTIDCSGLGTWDWNLQTNEIIYGGKWGEMLGYSLDELRSDVIVWQMLVHPDDYPHVIAAHEAHWRGDTAIYSAEYRMRSKRDEWCWIQSVGRVIAYDEKHQPLRMLGVNIDIHDRKKNEAALYEARLLAEEANRAKSEFLANISHEIRTPLNAILGFSTLLTDTALNNRQVDFVDSIHTAGDVLLGLINDLLDFSKIEAGRMDLENIEFDSRSTLEDTLDIVATRAAAKGLNLACLVEPSVPFRLIGDPSRLRQILLNLLNNAIKFTEQGDVVARARAQRQEDGRILLRIEVHDTGIGIPPEVQIKLFRPFTQADASTTRRFGGTGLGLSICRRLAEAMGGTIGVHSEQGKGSIFWVEVNLACVPDYCDLPALPTSVRGKTVLILDKAAINRELLQLLLESLGLHSHSCAGAEEMVAALRADPSTFSLAILGEEQDEGFGNLADFIHDLPECKSLPLVLLVSLATPQVAARVHSSHISAFLTKPVRQAQLLSCVRELFQLQVADHPIANTQAQIPQWSETTRPRLLLAEDNPVNQKVAALMLEGLGCTVDIVDTGVAAVAVLGVKAYDLVLMDCQMPEMDGFTATECIRAMPGARGGVPIVALTANAFKDDADRCFKAGMNDFVPKPFTKELLEQVLLRWLPLKLDAASVLGNKELLPVSSPVRKEEKLPSVLVDELEAIEKSFAELQANLGMDMREELLALYFPTQLECLQQLDVCLRGKDLQAARIAAHKLKGAAAQLGAKDLAAHCLALEHACRDELAESAQQEFVYLRELAEGLLQALNTSAV